MFCPFYIKSCLINLLGINVRMMKKVKYKDQNREFEMPSETFEKVFTPIVLKELIRNDRQKKPNGLVNIVLGVWNYLKNIPFIVRAITFFTN